MKKLYTFMLALAGVAAFQTPVLAHHSIAAVFDQQARDSITGTVVAFEFVNPHARLLLEVTDEQGRTETWDIEMAGRLNLSHGNFTEGTFTPGERLTVTGFPPHVKSPNLFFQSAMREDGTEVLPPGQERRGTLEEVRRQRQLARENSGQE